MPAFLRARSTGLSGKTVGKTVLFKCMSGLMPTTSGRIEIQLDDPAQKARPYCGVVIDGAGFNDSLSGLSNLVALADIT